MGNYRYVADANFEPFSMQEMLVPFQLYKDAYEKSEAAYNDLTTKADKYKYLSENLPEGSKARQIYEGYANSLNEQARDFAQNGLNMRNRAAIVSLKNRYQGEIGLLDRAETARQADIDEQRKIKAQAPARIFSQEAEYSNIDNYFDGQRKLYQNYSGALLTQQVGTAAAALAKSLTDYGNGKSLDKYTKTWIESHGFTPSQVMEAINNPNSPSSSPVLSSIVNSAIASSGIPQWGNVDALRRAKAYAVQGLWNAVGQSQVHSYDDYGAKQQLQFDNAVALEKEKLKLAQEAAAQAAVNDPGKASDGNLPINVVHLLSPNAAGKEGNKKMLEAMHILGFSDDGKRYKKTLTAQIHEYEDFMNSGRMKTKSIQVSIWNKNGSIKSEDKFIKDYSKSSADIADLRRFYRNTILPAVFTITGGTNPKNGYSWTNTGISNHISKYLNNNTSGSLYLAAMELPIHNMDSAVSRVIANTQANDDGDLSGVYKIQDFNKKGEMKLSKEPVNKDTFINKEGKLNGLISMYGIPGTEANKYIIIKQNGNFYAVDRSKLGSLGTTTFTGTGNAATYNDLVANRSAYLRTLMNRGMSATQALSMYNDALNNSGAGFIRDSATALDYQLDVDPYKVHTTSNTENP